MLHPEPHVQKQVPLRVSSFFFLLKQVLACFADWISRIGGLRPRPRLHPSQLLNSIVFGYFTRGLATLDSSSRDLRSSGELSRCFVLSKSVWNIPRLSHICFTRRSRIRAFVNTLFRSDCTFYSLRSTTRCALCSSRCSCGRPFFYDPCRS